MDFNEFEVRQELKKLGYGVGSCSGKAFQLTKKGGKPRKYDGLLRDLPQGKPMDTAVLVKIMRTSANANEAARRCEAICLGNPDPYQDKPSPEEIEARVQSGVQQVLEALGVTPELLARLKNAPPPVAAAPAKERESAPSGAVAVPAKKRGRPKGSKNKPKPQPPVEVAAE